MIYWIPIDFSIPIPIPTLGMVAWWLVVGCAVLVCYCGVFTAAYWDSSRPPEPLLFGFLLVPVIWPIAVWLIYKKIDKDKEIKQLHQDNIRAYTQHHIQED